MYTYSCNYPLVFERPLKPSTGHFGSKESTGFAANSLFSGKFEIFDTFYLFEHDFLPLFDVLIEF